MTLNSSPLIWLDLEMTGLDTQTDHIIEIATIVTTSQLDIIAEGPVIAIYQPPAVLDKLDDWNRHYHGKSGLLERVKHSPHSVSDAQAQTLRFLKQHVNANTSPMCGNSICQDRRFMARLMPELEAYFHYRNLDVSSIKELAKRWYPSHQFHKESTHVARQDIRDSIDELRHYRQHIFKA